MSSYVINKREFIKAAGIMCGFEEGKRYPHKYFIETVKARFVKCYELNVDSVAEQYGEESGCYDGSEYNNTFEEYRTKGRALYHNFMRVDDVRVGVKFILPRMMVFFRSVLYQIENEEMANVVGNFFFECIGKLMERDTEVDGWWGEIEI